MRGYVLPHLSALIITLGALFSIASTPTWADIPDSLNYQGILKTAGGSPVTDGSYTVTFQIYSVQSGGAALWTETKNVSALSGLFATYLGSVTPLPSTVFSSPNRFLGITVSPDPELTPRAPIVAVAYAYRIETVDGATGGTINGNLAVFNGDVDLDNSTATSGNVLKAGVPFIHNSGIDNTFVGVNAGNLTLTGNGNFAGGVNALHNNSTGSYNTASGLQVLQDNTSGSRNTASGYQAMQSNTTGEQNTAAGWIALGNNTAGSFNTAYGVNALRWNTTGNENTASGWGALLNNGTGYNNTAMGRGALLSNSTGYANTASGSNALSNNATGWNNTADGSESLYNNTAGGYNTASGVRTLYGNTIGTNNTASGWSALEGNTSGNNNSASGAQALQGNTAGSQNTACGVGALSLNSTGSNNTAIGFGANVASSAFTNATAIGSNALVNASNKIRLGDGSVTVIEGQVAYTFASDKNQKENFRPVDGDEVLGKIRNLDLTSWNYKGQDPQQFRHYGPMAQDFFQAFGHDGVGSSGTSTTINSGDEVGILMIAVQTLEKKNEELERRAGEIDLLKAQIAELRGMIHSQVSNQK